MTTAIVERNGAGPAGLDNWKMMLDQAEVLVKSGFLPRDLNTKEKAVAVMLKGRELGVPAMQALSQIAVINGKPVASAELMLALIYRDQGDEAIHFERSTTEVCTVLYKRRGWGAARDFSFTMEDAKRAGITGNQTWSKYPQAMLRARCVSAVARMAFPDSIGGLYTPEELGATVSMDGEEQTIDAPQIVTVDMDTGEISGPEPGEMVEAVARGAVRSAEADLNGRLQAAEQAVGKAQRNVLIKSVKKAVDALGMSEKDKLDYLAPFHARLFTELSDVDLAFAETDLTAQAAEVQPGIN